MNSTISLATAELSRQADEILGHKQSERVGVYLKMDKTVLEWFRRGGPGYQRRINEVLRRFVLAVDAGRTEAPPSPVELAQILFENYYTQCFWHMRPDLIVTEADIPQIVKGLKTYGGRNGYFEAHKLCRQLPSKKKF